MSNVDRLHEIIDTLPPRPIGNEDFARRLAEAPEEEVDEETATRILAAEAESGESISYGELKQRLGL